VSLNPEQRCKTLSAQVEGLCLLLLCTEAAVLIAAALPGPAVTAAPILPWLMGGALWLVWLATFVHNDRLVRCGSLATRRRYADRPVNRPGLALRLTFHALINWSALLVTVAVAALLQPGAVQTALARGCIAAAAAVWVYFNVRHRKHDKARNLALTSAFAVAVVASAALLLRDVH